MVPLIHPIFSQYSQHSRPGSWRCSSMASATTIWRHQVAFSWDRFFFRNEKRLRTILRQDLVTTSSSPWIRKDRCLFLFNDILLITTVSRRGAKVLAKLYFVEKFLGMNKHIQRRSREACPRCRAVCPRCWRCVGTSLWICSFYRMTFCFQIVDVPHPLRCRHLQGQRRGSEKAAQRIQVLQRCLSISLINNWWFIDTITNKC